MLNMAQLYKILFTTLLITNILFGQFIMPKNNTIFLIDSVAEKTFLLDEVTTDSISVTVNRNAKYIDTISTTGITLQPNIEQLSSANRWATNLGSWTTSGDMSATWQSSGIIALSNIPTELNSNTNFVETQTLTYTSDYSASADGMSATRSSASGNNDAISDGVTSYDNVYKFYANTTSGTHYTRKLNIMSGYLSTDLITFKAYIPNSNTHVDGIWIGNAGSNGSASSTIRSLTCKKIIDDSNYGTIANTREIRGIKGYWVEVTAKVQAYTYNEFTIGQLSGTNLSFVGSDLSADDIVYVKDLKHYSLSYNGWTPSTMNATNYLIYTSGLNYVSDGTSFPLTSGNILQSGHTYQYTITATITSNGIKFDASGGNPSDIAITTSGTHTGTFVADGTTVILNRNSGTANALVTYLSITEVKEPSKFSLLSQTTTSNKNYKLSFEAKSSLSSKKIYYNYASITDSLSLTSSYQVYDKSFWGQGTDTIKFWASENTSLDLKNISLKEIATKKIVTKGNTTKIYFTPNTSAVGSKTASITLNENKTVEFNYDVVYSNKAYYVSNSGNDANDGLSQLTAWETLAKVQDYDTTTGFNEGDKILFDATSIFDYPNLTLTSSGTENAPIEINTYNGINGTFNSGNLLNNYILKESPSSITLDTVAQNLANTGKVTIAGEYYTGYKVTFVDGTLKKYFALSSETSPVKSQVKLYTSTDGLSFSVVPNSESVVLEATTNGINTYNLKTPLTVTAGDYWIILVANGTRYVPYQTTTSGDSNYFYYNYSNAWNVGAAEATFLSSISSSTTRHIPNVAIGAEIENITSGLEGTIYKTIVENVKEVRLNGGQGVLGSLVNYADLDNENEYSIVDDSVFVFNDTTNNVAIMEGFGLKIEGDNYLVKNLYLKQNDSALVMNGNNIDIDSVYFLNNKYAFINNGENKIRQSKFVQNKTAISNDSMDIYTNWFINSGLIGSSTLNFTSGNSRVIHNSFYITLDSGKAFIENSGGLLQLVDNAFESLTNDYMIYTSEAIPEANANAYAGNRTFYLNGSTYSSGTEWSAHNPENNIVLLETINYTDLYNLNVSDNTTNVIDAGIETDIAYDIHGNQFPYDPTSLGYGNEDIGASEYQGAWNEGEVTPIPSGRVIYVRANGSNDYATYATNSITGVSIDALKSNINNEADGVTVLFQKNNFFRVSDLYIHDVNNLTIGAYGSGLKPIIEIRDTLKGIKNSAYWSYYAPNVYRFSLIPSGNSQISAVSRLWIDGQEYEASINSSIIPEANTDMALGEQFRWIYYPSSSSIMFWVPTGQMPYNIYNSVTLSSGNRLYGIRINNCDNVTIDGLQINASMQGAIWLGGTGSTPATNSGIVTDVEIKNCKLLYGFQAGIVARGDGVDRLNVHHNTIDKKTDETFGGIRIHEMHHVVDLQWGCDDIELHHNEIKGAGISSMRLIGANGSGYSENIKIHDNYIWSSSAWCRAFNVSVATGGTNNDRAKNVKIYNNYFENMRTRTQATAIDFQVYYNVFDSTIAYQDVKVLHHLGETSEGYEISDNDNGYWEFSDETSIQLNDLYYFNNTLFVSGREMFYGLRTSDGDDRTYICNNAFINAGKSTLVTTYSQDVILASSRNYTIRNNYSWNDKRTTSQYAVKLGSSYYTWSGANAANFTYADFEANIQHGTSNVANYNLLFEDPESNDFRVKPSSYMYQTGYMNQTLLNILGANFYDQFGNQVTNNAGALVKTLNIGAVNN